MNTTKRLRIIESRCLNTESDLRRSGIDFLILKSGFHRGGGGFSKLKSVLRGAGGSLSTLKSMLQSFGGTFPVWKSVSQSSEGTFPKSKSVLQSFVGTFPVLKRYLHEKASPIGLCVFWILWGLDWILNGFIEFVGDFFSFSFFCERSISTKTGLVAGVLGFDVLSQFALSVFTNQSGFNEQFVSFACEVKGSASLLECGGALSIVCSFFVECFFGRREALEFHLEVFESIGWDEWFGGELFECHFEFCDEYIFVEAFE